jgi:hypothetical protein
MPFTKKIGFAVTQSTNQKCPMFEQSKMLYSANQNCPTTPKKSFSIRNSNALQQTFFYSDI